MAITPLNYYANSVVGSALTINNSTPEITGVQAPPTPGQSDFLVAIIGTRGLARPAPEVYRYIGWEILSTVEVLGTAGQEGYLNNNYRLTVLTRPFVNGAWTFELNPLEWLIQYTQMTGIVIGFRGAGAAQNPISISKDAWTIRNDIPGRVVAAAGSYYLIASLQGRSEDQWYQSPNNLPTPYQKFASSYSTPEGASTDPVMFLQGYEGNGSAPGATTVYHGYPGVSAAVTFELLPTKMLEHLAWDVSDDLPTEDVTQPGFVRKALSITLPRPDPCPEDVILTNPLASTWPLYRGRPINSQVQGGQIRYQLDGIEARWQRARPKKSILQTGALTIKQALVALLTARQAEFSYIQWGYIPEIHWPDGSIPQFPNLVISVDPSDPGRKTVYDEVVALLAAAPGYSLDFDVNNRLRIVIPPFAPNAQDPLNLYDFDGNFEETGYVTTDIVRSVRVLSKPFEFLDSAEDAIKPITARFANSIYQIVATDSRLTTTGSIGAGSSSLSVQSIIDFAVGQYIYVAGAGAGGAGLVAAINGITGTTLTLSANASTSVQSVLVRHAGLYPPVDDDAATEDRDIVYGPDIFEDTFVIPYTPNILVDYSTFKVNVILSRWRYPEKNGIPIPEQLDDQAAVAVPVPNDGIEHLVFDQPNGTWVDFAVLFQGPVRVYCTHINQGIRCRIQFTAYVDGAVWRGFGQFTGRRWELGARFRITATSKRWQQGTTGYVGEYLYEPGYSDLPDLDVSSTGIADNATLQALARHIANYKSRQATRIALKINQPWNIEPDDKGRRVNLPNGDQVIPDSYRLGVSYSPTGVQASMDILAWRYARFAWLLATASGDLLATADGTVIEV